MTQPTYTLEEIHELVNFLQEGVYTLDDVAARYQVTPEQIGRWVADGHFPAPVRIGNAADRWLHRQLMEWEDRLLAAMDDAGVQRFGGHTAALHARNRPAHLADGPAGEQLDEQQ